MEVSTEMSKMIEVIKKYDDQLRKGNDAYKYYFAPNIPEKVMKGLVSHFDNNLPFNSVIAYYDTTVFNSSKAGFVFTDDGLYYKYMGKPYYFAYKDMTGFEIKGKKLCIRFSDEKMPEYVMDDVFDMKALNSILSELKEIDDEYGQLTEKSTGKVKKLELPSDMEKKCVAIIHGASAACGGVGTGMAQIPLADNAVIVPIQVGMIVSLGTVFDLNITESVAKSIIASAGATVIGRGVSQVLFGWIPVAGNAINTATAAGVTELIGWTAVKNFYERWIEDRNKGRFDGMKVGYVEASNQYHRKLLDLASEFTNQKKDFEIERDKYEELLDEYEDHIEKMRASINELEGMYNKLKSLEQ